MVQTKKFTDNLKLLEVEGYIGMYPTFERPKIQFELIVTFLLESKSTV